MTVLIPTGYFRIVCSELRAAKAEIMWNPARRLLLVKLTSGENEHLIGPFDNGGELEALLHALKDVYDMKGQYGAC